MESEAPASYLYTILGHPLRREIIRILGSKKGATFTELKTALRMSVGTLYYNLDLLEGLVTQNETRRYVLTKQGERAYAFLLESEERLVSLGIEAEMRRGVLGTLGRWLMAWGLFTLIQESPKMFVPLIATILIYGSWITYHAGLFPIIFLYSDRPVHPILAPLLFLVGLVAVNLLGNAFSAIFYRRPLQGAGTFFISSCFAILPSLLTPTVYYACKTFLAPVSLILIQSIMLVSLGFSLFFITTAISTSKGLRVEKAAVITTILLYVMIAIALVIEF